MVSLPRRFRRELTAGPPWISALLLCSLVVCVRGSCGGLNDHDCAQPYLYGGGTPTFSSAASCYAEGTTVTIECSGELYGSPVVTCLEGYWVTSDMPTCEESFCSSPNPPDHGSELYPMDEYVLYDTAFFSCDNGYSLIGSTEVTCSGTGEWVPTIPKCKEHCLVPVIANGNTSSAHGTSKFQGQDIEVACDEGYSLTGPRDVTCNDGNWEPFIGQCLSHCPHPSVANSNFAEASSHVPVAHGDHVVVQCDFGYSPGSGANLPVPLTCHDGLWDSTVTCSESEDCSSVPEVLGGGTPSFSPDETCYPLGTEVDISCSGVLFGSSNAFYNGSWSYDWTSSSPTCEESYCPVPTPPEHGSEEYPGGLCALYDETSFDCDDGYSLVGSRQVMCTGTGQWEPAIPSCAENCIVPSVANGNCSFAPGTLLQSGQTISILCEDDFTLTGPNSATCRNGVWEPFIGECLRNCPAPTIANSNHAQNRAAMAHGDYVIVECDEGYTSGSDFPTPVTCHDGQWDSDVMCHEYANCTSTPTVYGGGTPNFSPSVSCYPGGSNVTIDCSGVLFGSSNAYYSHRSFWYFDNYGAPPTCEEYFCPPPTPPLHGSEEDPTNLYVLYDTAFFSCDNGYSLFGSQEVMCYGTGEWTPAVPTCEEHCDVPALSNGNTSFAPGTSVLSGEVLLVSCDQGFTLTGPSSVTCRDGTWQAAIGQCLENCVSPLIANSNYEALQHEVNHGAYVVVTCDNGYTSGSGSSYSTPMTCSDGVWDTSVDCYANCAAPTFPPSMRISPAARTDDAHYYHNDVITVTCAPNYRHINGPTSGELTCNDGYWTPDYLPVCV